MLRKVVVYHIKTEKCKKIKIVYDLKLLTLKKMKHWIYKESRHFQKFIFIQKWWRKKNNVLGQL